MRMIEFAADVAVPIQTFKAVAAASVALGHGTGDVHVYCLHFAAGGQIGDHPAGFGQLFLVVAGQGWAAGADGVRVNLAAGQGVSFAPGEVHSKGSDAGMTAIMVQADQLAPAGAESDPSTQPAIAASTSEAARKTSRHRLVEDTAQDGDRLGDKLLTHRDTASPPGIGPMLVLTALAIGLFALWTFDPGLAQIAIALLLPAALAWAVIVASSRR